MRAIFFASSFLSLILACNHYGLVEKLENPGGKTGTVGSGGQFTSLNYIFVSSWSTPGDMGSQPFAACSGFSGVARADCACTEAARLNHLLKSPTHQFRAWLSTGSNDARCRVLGQANSCSTSIHQPWFNTMGQQLVLNYSHLFNAASTTLGAAIRYSEDGADIGHDLVWTGTSDLGVNDPNCCSDWTSDTSGYTGRVGDRTKTTNEWTANGSPTTQSCNSSLRIYCVAMP